VAGSLAGSQDQESAGGRFIKRRLDAELVRRGLVPSREAARRLIISKQVLVDGSFADKPARMVDGGQAIVFVNPPPPFVSRAGVKLDGALDLFAVDPTGRSCLDAGSSTGGFTDCLLQRGAARVVAVDVGTNQLHERIRADERVQVLEQTDVRSLGPDDFESLFDLIVGDLSFISLRLVLPSLGSLLADGGQMVLLIKPQFEAGRVEAARGKGIISDPEIWRRTLEEVLSAAAEVGLTALGLAPSAIRGSQGNVEFVTWLADKAFTIEFERRDGARAVPTIHELIQQAVGRASTDRIQRQKT
jgi:23S rRNA (cytidine1920-2'-O)/16S rRNA (cytidine1409-2'-O)-methyltransferase